MIDLQSELSKSPNKQNTNHTEVYHRLEKKLAEKTHLLNTSQEFIRDLQAKYDKEMAQLRDELDIAQSKMILEKLTVTMIIKDPAGLE